MVRYFIVAVLTLGLLAAPEARAQEAGGRGQGWSVLSGDTLGAGRMAIHAQAGYPGLSVGLLGGVAERFDLGARLTFNYALEGLTSGRNFYPELKLQGLLRLGLVDTGRINLGLTFEPGPLVYFASGFSFWGLSLPVALTLGIPVGSALMVNVGFDLPIYVLFDSGVYAPILFGGGLEYFIDRNLAVTVNLRMGPTIKPYQRAEFTLNWLLGVAYRF